MLRWDDYKLLLAVHRSKTLRGAAQRLKQNHVTTMRSIDRINKQNPSALIERTACGLVLTSFGTIMLATALKIESAIEEEQRSINASGEHTEKVVLSLAPAIYEYLLLEPLLQFCNLHPSVKLEINTGYQFANLDENEADIVIRVADAPGDSYVGYRICPVSLGFYAHVDYFQRTPLEDQGWITNHHYENAQRYINQSPYPNAPILFTIDDLVSRHKLAACGHGMIVGAPYIAHHFEQLHRFSSQIFEFADMWVLAHETRIEIPRIKELMAYLRESLKASRNLINS